jgi:PadR family transcriptional regulator, regulatory protein AphA
MSLRHATLGLLARRPSSGYDLLQVFEKSLANVWSATQSQLYAELNRLAEAGLVTVSAEGPRGRKEYAITDDGLAELRHWITDVEPAVQRRSDMLLRVFFLGLVRRDEAEAYLRRRGDVFEEETAELTGIADEIADGDDPLAVYGRIALEWGLRYMRMQREWSEWALAELAAAGPVPAESESAESVPAER